MASPGNRHCASCIGALSFPMGQCHAVDWGGNVLSHFARDCCRCDKLMGVGINMQASNCINLPGSLVIQNCTCFKFKKNYRVIDWILVSRTPATTPLLYYILGPYVLFALMIQSASSYKCNKSVKCNNTRLSLNCTCLYSLSRNKLLPHPTQDSIPETQHRCRCRRVLADGENASISTALLSVAQQWRGQSPGGPRVPGQKTLKIFILQWKLGHLDVKH